MKIAASQIARHEIDVAFAHQRVQEDREDLPTLVEAARKDLTRCNMLRFTASAYAGEVEAVEPGSPEVCRGLRLGAQTMAAMFKAATADSSDVDVQLDDGGPVSVSARTSPASVNVANWKHGFYHAVICREKPILDLLCRVPADLLRGVKGFKADECVYLHAEALRAYWQQADDAPERLAAALEATAPESLEFAPGDLVLDLWVPEMELLYRVMLKDEQGFNEALRKALELHKRYWGQKKDNRWNDAQAFLSIPITALSCLAWESDLEVKVSSDYIPRWLVEGDCHP
jgi:hypothetical protein